MPRRPYYSTSSSRCLLGRRCVTIAARGCLPPSGVRSVALDKLRLGTPANPRQSKRAPSPRRTHRGASVSLALNYIAGANLNRTRGRGSHRGGAPTVALKLRLDLALLCRNQRGMPSVRERSGGGSGQSKAEHSGPWPSAGVRGAASAPGAVPLKQAHRSPSRNPGNAGIP
jgi:hypothetical protein